MTIKTISAVLTSSAFLFTAAVATSQTPQQQPQPREQGTQQQQQRAQADPMAEVTLQGCLAHDESRGMAGASQQTASAQTFLLKNVSMQGAGATGQQPGATTRQPGAADQQPRTGTGQGNYGAQGGQQGQQRADQAAGAQRDRQQATGAASHHGDKDKTYRVVASQANVDLAKHVGHTVEVKGRVTEAAQTAQKPSEQTGGNAPRSAAAFENEHKTLTVTSLRHISESCQAEESAIR
jgi:hypothetical protein